MALNKYMHPRNIYKTPPDFGKLSKLYPEFANISKMDVTGKVNIDFKDPNALRILTKYLLLSDFNLFVDIPENRLVPTLPLRLNYVLWIEDLLTSLGRNDNIWGIDIGTGACAIYPLLAAVKNKWNMVATESDSESLKKANENILKNNLSNLITLKHNTAKTIISHIFTEENKLLYDFCMCNPPFYSNIQELCESRSPARLPPKNGFTGSPQELITEGGELEFSRKLIKESEMYKDGVLLYTTMIGHKYNLNLLINDLKFKKIKHTHTEFCQGRVTRWGIAWTFKGYDLYNLVSPRDKPRKKQTPTLYILPALPNCDYNIEVALTKLKDILNSLSITHDIIEKRGNNVSLSIVANSNTWSNQRKKRRIMKRMECDTKKPKLDTPNHSNSTDSNLVTELQVNNTTEPPSIESGQPNFKSEDGIDKNENGNISDISAPCSNNHPLVQAFMKLMKKGNDILLEIEFLDGKAGKEGLHQIVQFIKNNWKYFLFLFLYRNLTLGR